MTTPSLPVRSSASRWLVRALAFALPVFLSAATYTASTASALHSALAAVNPGDVVVVSGTLTGNFSLGRSGTAAAPITIRGDGTARLVSTSGYGLEIQSADHVALEDLVISGGLKGLVIDDSNHGRVDRVHIMDTRQEAFKVRNQSQYWEFTFCSARRAGTSGDYGEGFYVGQASSNWINGTPDRSGFITFFNCYTTDTVNDGWDLKEGAHDIKMVNCTADFSGAIEPAENAARGSAGFYLRADRLQVIKCSVLNLGNNDWAYRISNQSVQGVDYGSSGNEVKESAALDGNVGFIYLETGTNGVVYTDYSVNTAQGLYAQNSAAAVLRDPAQFVELTWAGVGGGIWGDLSATVGSGGDPMAAGGGPGTVAAPTFQPAAGHYSTAQSVSLSTTTSGATIRYTLDGSTPTATSGTVYSGPFTISVATTVKAVAYQDGMTTSGVSSAAYTFGTSTTPAKFVIDAGAVSASAQNSNIAANTVDGNLGTRWEAQGDGQWIRYDLGTARTVTSLRLAWYNGKNRTYTFDVEASGDGLNWSAIVTGATNARNNNLQTVDFADVTARYVRIVGHGNSANNWNAITETEVWGF